MIYIEKYAYETKFCVTEFFSQFEPGKDYDTNWPAVLVSSSRNNYQSFLTSAHDFFEGKKRTKPSICLTGGVESVFAEMVRVLGLKNMVFSVLSSCTSSAYAIFQAGLISQHNNTPVLVLCADNFTPLAHFWFHSLGAVSPETGIPFDKHSLGFRPTEAQAFFVVSAKPINPVAEIETIRFLTQPKERTAVGSISELMSLFDNIDLDEISWWNAHAPGTPVGDKAEYELFAKFNKDIPISSLKGRLGHGIASSYLLELGTALDCLKGNSIPGNVGIREKIFNDDRIIVQDVNTPLNKKFVKFNMGFGGKNVLSVINSFC